MGDTERPQRRQVVDEHVFKILGASAFLLLVVGTVVFRILEDWSWVDSLYFSVVAVTTVGFGDLHPTTDGSKLFSVVYILLGISIVTTYLNQRLKIKGSQRVEEIET